VDRVCGLRSAFPRGGQEAAQILQRVDDVLGSRLVELVGREASRAYRDRGQVGPVCGDAVPRRVADDDRTALARLAQRGFEQVGGGLAALCIVGTGPRVGQVTSADKVEKRLDVLRRP
jgi:hypothetical protein